MSELKLNTIHWFRKGLRLHDNPSLLAAIENSCHFWPVFILDPWFVKNMKIGANRWRFLVESLHDLDTSLKKINSRLFVLRGNPVDVFPELFKKWKINKLTFECDTEPYSKIRDAKIEAIAKSHNVIVVVKVSNTLYNVDRITAHHGGPPLAYQSFLKTLSQLDSPCKPVVSLIDLKGAQTPLENNHNELYGIPTLKDLGVDNESLSSSLYPGGESEALKRLSSFLCKKSWICKFEKPKTEPNSIVPSTTVLSPYIKFGCLSVRTFYYKIEEIYNESKIGYSKPPCSLHGQLLWREFFYTVGSVVPNFDQMIDNPICRQIPWEKNKAFLNAWAEGKTGYPFIDAIMTQLKTEGWIHHLARHAVACFLTRGDLWVPWEDGMKVFEENLLDADWSLNAGNWMWLSASAFFNQYFRVYSPIAFGKKTDKDGLYIKKYLPILKKYPSQYIYEPWKAPLQIQKQAGCIIGKDYPKPIVDHDFARTQNLKKMAEAYKSKQLMEKNDYEAENKDVTASPVKSSGQKRSGSNIMRYLKKERK